jgi:hypothetical protein
MPSADEQLDQSDHPSLASGRFDNITVDDKSRDKPLLVITGPSGMSKSKTISSCESKPGGPTLGRFILQRTNDKWYITGHETEKC